MGEPGAPSGDDEQRADSLSEPELDPKRHVDAVMGIEADIAEAERQIDEARVIAKMISDLVRKLYDIEDDVRSGKVTENFPQSVQYSRREYDVMIRTLKLLRDYYKLQAPSVQSRVKKEKLGDLHEADDAAATDVEANLDLYKADAVANANRYDKVDINLDDKSDE